MQLRNALTLVLTGSLLVWALLVAAWLLPSLLRIPPVNSYLLLLAILLLAVPLLLRHKDQILLLVELAAAAVLIISIPAGGLLHLFVPLPASYSMLALAFVLLCDLYRRESPGSIERTYIVGLCAIAVIPLFMALFVNLQFPGKAVLLGAAICVPLLVILYQLPARTSATIQRWPLYLFLFCFLLLQVFAFLPRFVTTEFSGLVFFAMPAILLLTLATLVFAIASYVKEKTWPYARICLGVSIISSVVTIAGIVLLTYALTHWSF